MSATRQKSVIILGPAAPVHGGIAAVVDALGESSLREQFRLAIVNTGKVTPRGRPWYVAVGHQVALFWTVARMLVRGHGQLVHIQTCSGFVFWRDAMFQVLARLFRRRVIWHVHGGAFDEFVDGLRGGRRWALGRSFSSSDGAIVTSESWRTRLERQVRPPRWAVVQNGVRLPSSVSTPSTRNAFLFVGTLDNVKGAEDLVVATAMAAHAGFRGRVRLAGAETAPGQRDRLLGLARREGVTEQIELLGVVAGHEKAMAFETAAAFVLPSYVENLPIAMLEAMSHGLPVIVTDAGVVAEVITDGVEGFVIKPGDVAGLADRLQRLWADPALRDRMGAAGRRRVEVAYTAETMATKVADVYHGAFR
jgi:glycosyltransferase involved in cell wall biosynthesis